MKKKKLRFKKYFILMAYVRHLIFATLFAGISGIAFDELDTVGNITSLCPFTNFCSVNASSTITSGSPCCVQCSCESNCNKRGNCCPDAKTVYDPTIELQECYLPAHNYFLDDNSPLFIGIYGYHAYVRCPPRYTNERIKNKCERKPRFIDEITLVSDKDDFVFKNRYCAECNSKTEYKTWLIKILCTEGEGFYTLSRKLDIISQNDSCNIWSVPRKSDIAQSSRCFRKTIDSCNLWLTKTLKNGKDLEKLCSSYTLNYISYSFPNQYGAPNIFKNVHCFLCNEAKFESSERCKTLTLITRLPDVIHFTALLNLALEPQTRTPIRSRCHKNCGEVQVYDPYFDKCRSIICPWHSVPKKSGCQPKYLTTFGKTLAILFMVTPSNNSSLSLFTSQQKSVEFWNSLRQSLLNALKINCGVCNVRFVLYNRTAFLTQIIYFTTPQCSWNYLYQHLNDHLKRIYLYIRHWSTNSLLKFRCDVLLNFKDIVGFSHGAFRYHPADKRCFDVIVYTQELTCPKVILDVQEYDTFIANFKYADRVETVKEYNDTTRDFLNTPLSDLLNAPRVIVGYRVCASGYIKTISSACCARTSDYCLIPIIIYMLVAILM